MALLSRFLPLALLAVFSVLSLGCSGSGSGTPLEVRRTDPAPVVTPPARVPDPAKLTVSLAGEVTDPQLAVVKLGVRQVEAEAEDGTWKPLALAAPDSQVDLLERGNRFLVVDAPLPPGTYRRLRLTLAQGRHRVRLAGQTDEQPWALAKSVLVAHRFGSLELKAGEQRHLAFLVRLGDSIQPAPGAPGFASSFATAEVLEHWKTGSIAGRIRDAQGASLAGVQVLAQLSDIAEVERSTVTGADGIYSLELLPLGHYYRVVAQPPGRPPAPPFQARAVRVPLSSDKPSVVCHLEFQPLADPPGTLTIQALEPGDPEDQDRSVQIDLVLTQPHGAPPTKDWKDWLVIRRWLATRSGTATFDRLPPGQYALRRAETMEGVAPGQYVMRRVRTEEKVDLPPGGHLTVPFEPRSR